MDNKAGKEINQIADNMAAFLKNLVDFIEAAWAYLEKFFTGENAKLKVEG